MQSWKWTILNMLGSCDSLRTFKQIHAQLIAQGLVHDTSVVIKVTQFFENSVAFLNYACRFLNSSCLSSNSFPFNTLIAGYANSHRPQAAFLLYKRLLLCGFRPDLYTIPVMLKSCAKFSGTGEGKQIHGLVAKMGFWSDLYVQNSLLHCYGACGEYLDASRMFDEMLIRDIVSWTGLMSGCVKAGLFDEAVSLFIEMDVEPNVAAFISALVACGQLGCLNLGKSVHGLLWKHGFVKCLAVSNAVLDMYVKSESLHEAERLFNEIQDRDIVTWTCMINGFVHCNSPVQALDMFSTMQILGLEPDKVTLTSVLTACSSLGALEYGRWVHEYMDRKCIKWDVHVGTALVDMYAKCGCIEMALKTFSQMSDSNVFTWNALLGGLAIHGHGHEAIKRFEQMISGCTKPNEVTFLAILTACCHSGMVEKGRNYFYMMKSEVYKLSPRLEHYGCMVDLLSRAGLLDEARAIIKSMPMSPDMRMLGTFLSACMPDGNVELSQDTSDYLHELELQSLDNGIYVLLSNLYASNGRWEDVTRIRKSMKEKGLTKAPGSSVIEVDGRAYKFLVGDADHPQSEDIYLSLNTLTNEVHPDVHFSCSFF